MRNLANIAWAVGDLAATEAGYREQIELLRASPAKTNRLLGWALTSLAAVLTERGEIEQALVLAREGLPLLAEDGSAWIFIDSLALRAARAGDIAAAARLAGYADRAFATKEATRHPIELRHRSELHALLQRRLSDKELVGLLAQGARMSDEEADRLAVQR